MRGYWHFKKLFVKKIIKIFVDEKNILSEM